MFRYHDIPLDPSRLDYGSRSRNAAGVVYKVLSVSDNIQSTIIYFP